MAKIRAAQASGKYRTFQVARDPYPPSHSVQKAVEKQAKIATRETQVIKNKRPAG